MIVQFLEGFPGANKENDFVVNPESDEFYAELEEFFTDYEEIISDVASDKLERFAISEEFSSTFPAILLTPMLGVL
jgi:hypothetical protein